MASARACKQRMTTLHETQDMHVAIMSRHCSWQYKQRPGTEVLELSDTMHLSTWAHPHKATRTRC